MINTGQWWHTGHSLSRPKSSFTSSCASSSHSIISLTLSTTNSSCAKPCLSSRSMYQTSKQFRHLGHAWPGCLQQKHTSVLVSLVMWTSRYWAQGDYAVTGLKNLPSAVHTSKGVGEGSKALLVVFETCYHCLKLFRGAGWCKMVGRGSERLRWHKSTQNQVYRSDTNVVRSEEAKGV